MIVELPAKLLPLMEELRRRYYVAYGGRGGARSWSFARSLLVQSLREPLRILCCREVMKTIADSVHRLLADQIELLGLSDSFDVQETTIKGRNGAEFIYAGLRSLDAQKIKSYEGVDIAWVEEAENVSKRSWNILIPTIRAPESEIWVSFNPNLDSDETYQRFVVKPPEDAWVQKVNYRDNPWFPKVLEKDRLQMKRDDPDEYDNIWEGNPRAVAAGAIYAKEVTKMIEDRRYRAVPYDPRLKVHTIWDLGWNDQTSIIFAQRLLSEVRVIDYEEESFLRADEWAVRLEKKGYHYGDHWLPHDGKHETQQGGGVSLQDQLKPHLGKRPKIIKRPASVEDPIRMSRLLFPRVYMDDERCSRLMDCLKRFRRAIPETTGEPGIPVKDEYRHGADAFGGLAMIVDQLGNEDNKPSPPYRPAAVMDKGMGR